jgi:hypothetical protein
MVILRDRGRRLSVLVAFALWLSVASAGFGQGYFVRDVDDLYGHFALHKANVTRLAVELWHRRPERYHACFSLHELLAFIGKHDNAKLDESMKADGRPTFVERLMPYYGKGYGYLSASPLGLQTIAELNAADKAITTSHLVRHGFATEDGAPNRCGRLLLEIERIADVVDRNANPVAFEEFGILTFDEELLQAPDFWQRLGRAAVPLSRFLTRKLPNDEQYQPDEELLALAEPLRDDWRTIVGGVIFAPHSGRHGCSVAYAQAPPALLMH